MTSPSLTDLLGIARVFLAYYLKQILAIPLHVSIATMLFNFFSKFQIKYALNMFIYKKYAVRRPNSLT